MQTSTYSARVKQELADFAWSQWAQLGVSASATRRDGWAIDPEALLFFTLDIGRHDPRLFDETLDWLRLNGRLISLQRLRNLASSWSMSPQLIDAAAAWAALHNPGLPWARQKSAHAPRELHDSVAEDLFPGLRVPEADPVFLSYGLRRPIAAPSGKSQLPDLQRPIALAFRLRQLFGIGTRAEVIRVLLTISRPDASAQDVADPAGYSKRNVSEALDALVAAGVGSVRQRGNEHVHSLEQRRWLTLLDLQSPPEYVDWPRVLRLLIELEHWLQENAPEKRSDYMRASAARDFVDRVAPLLVELRIQQSGSQLVSGPAYWPAFVAMIDTLLSRLRPTSSRSP